MNKKSIKPNTDLVLARLAIFGMVAIVFTVLSINGLPSWFMWLVMLWGVFSIFSAAIEAEDDAEAIYKLEKVVFNHHEMVKAEIDEYKAVAENLDEMYVREVEKSKLLQGKINDLNTRIDSAQFTLEEIRERLLDSPETQDLCDLAYVILEGKKTTDSSKDCQFNAGDEITAKFNNFMDQEMIVTGVISEVKRGILCCNDKITGRPFAVNFDEVLNHQVLKNDERHQKAEQVTPRYALQALKQEISELHGQCDLHLVRGLEEKFSILDQALGAK